jgi:hypothetical protein
MFDVISRRDPPPITHPPFYYGFVGAFGVVDSIFGMLFVIAFLKTRGITKHSQELTLLPELTCF